jgi:hypothetical protein
MSIDCACFDTSAARVDGQNISAPSAIALLRAAYGQPFDEKMKRLTAMLREQQAEPAKLDGAISANLKELGYGE